MQKLNNHIVANKIFPYLPTKIRNVFYYRFLWNADFPEIVHIENTNACNAACIMCPREKMTRKIGLMDFGLFKKVINECSSRREVKEVHVHGFGEPLLDKNINDKIIFAKKAGIKKVYFVTNASLLTEEISTGLIKADLDGIKFSMYGNSCAIYEAIHKGLDYETVEQHIVAFLKIRKKLNKNKPFVKIQFVPQKENIHEREAFLKKWNLLIDKRFGDSVEEFSLHNWIYGRSYINVNNTPIRKSCGLPFVSLQILWDGMVTACCYDYDGKIDFGNVNSHTIFQIWNSKPYVRFRCMHRMAEFQKIDICNLCDQLRQENVVCNK